MSEAFEATGAAHRRGHRAALAAFLLLIVAPLVAVAVISAFLFRPAPGYLEFELEATGGTAAQLFWTSTWAFTQEDSTIVALHQRPGTPDRVRFPLPSRPLEFVRFDPIDGAGEVLIHAMRVVDPDGRPLRDIDPMVMSALYQIDSMTPEGRTVRVRTTPGANDPMLLLRSQWLTAPPRWNSVQFVTPFSLAWIAAAAGGLLLVGLGLMVRDVSAGPFTRPDALWLTAVFLIVVAAKLMLLRFYPMPVPFWDQWDGEAANLYLPYSSGGLTWRQMFTLHNEHRIFFTRVLAVVLLALNGQWDPHLQIVVNIALHAITAVVLTASLWLAAGRRWLGWIAITVALAVAPPFALENTLAGFQSAFYFLVLFSALALWLMTTHRPGSGSWIVGWACALATVVTVAGGVLTPVAIAVVSGLAWLARPRDWMPRVATAGALGVVAAVGYAAMAPPLPYHDYLKAGTFLAFRVALERALAFPWLLVPRASAVAWLPAAALGLLVIVRRFKSGGFDRYVLGLGAWVAVQSAAVAYSRGANGAIPASRYLDMLSFGFVVNTMALIAILATVRHPKWLRTVGWAAVALWVGVGALGIDRLSDRVLAADGQERRHWMRTYVHNVREFLITDDLGPFLRKTGPQEIPYFSAGMLAGWLRDPAIRRLMPASLRPPMRVAAKPGTTPTFARSTVATEIVPGWDSYATGGAGARGRFESDTLRCADFHRLRFEITGWPGSSGLRLMLKEAASGRETEVEPPMGSGTGWRSVHVACPAGPFIIVAEDTSTTSSFGFRPPTEIGWGSAAAETLIQRASWVTLLAAAVTLLAVAGTVTNLLASRDETPTAPVVA
ncbi:MAG: hypothetical protein ABIX28_17260 [Vicinamibacterales bacterium]